jgi:hypothetical protein
MPLVGGRRLHPAYRASRRQRPCPPQRETPAPPPAVTRVDPFSDAARLQRIRASSRSSRAGARAKRELGTHGDPPPHFIAYEVYDQRRVTMAAQFER